MKNRTKSELRNAASPSGILSRLRNDVAGNTLILVALATVPLVGLIGAGVDVSRTYLVKSRLQQACDAGVLAGRKFMTGTTLTTAAAAQAQSYFANNFPTGAFGASGISFTPTANTSGVVNATASASVPATVMTAFGNGSVPLNVVCQADLKAANTDVMFVLDLSGSMLWCPDGNTSCNGGSGSRIAALRTAVVSFYDALAANAQPTARNRFGFVNYANTVNVGGLLPSSSIVDSWNYQSRVANMTTPVPTVTTTAAVNIGPEVNSSSISQSACATYGTNSGNPVVVTGAPPTETITTYSNNNTSGVDWSWVGAPDTSGTNRSCRRTRMQQTRTTVTNYGFTNWTYKKILNVNVAAYKTGSSITYATNQPTGTVPSSGSYDMISLATIPSAGTTNASVSWTTNRCIEERDTVSQATFPTIPTNAYDLDIDTAATSNATKWRPAINELIHDRFVAAEETTTADRPIFQACTAASRKLAVMTKSEVETYVNGLVAFGGTYHDIGMIWGARLISPTGIFASENATAPNGSSINRHIVFLTDGEMSPNPNIYTPYGVEFTDNRIGYVAPDTAALTARHNERFLAMCRAARAKNITVWTVAFGTGLTQQLTDCADPGKALVASNAAILTQHFQTIAARISDLRLIQ